MVNAKDTVGVPPSGSLLVALHVRVSVVIGEEGVKLRLSTDGVLLEMVTDALSEAVPVNPSATETLQVRLFPGWTIEGLKVKVEDVPRIVPETDHS